MRWPTPGPVLILMWLSLATSITAQACVGHKEATFIGGNEQTGAGANDAGDGATLLGGDASGDGSPAEADDGAAADADAAHYGHSAAPLLHRPVAGACTKPRPASDALTIANCSGDGAASPCTDASCASGGANGRCECYVQPAVRTVLCTYDDCASDADCGAGKACLCRETALPAGLSADASPTQRTVCVSAECRVDSDCGAGGYCSPSQGPCDYWFTVGFHCHTATDECFNDSDCGQPNSYCVYQGTRWACTTPSSCADG